MEGFSGSREGSALDELSLFHQSSLTERKTSSDGSKSASFGRTSANENVRHSLRLLLPPTLIECIIAFYLESNIV